jgi:hypothetical protein
MLVRRFEFQQDPGNYIFLSFITKQIEKKAEKKQAEGEEEKKEEPPLIQEEEEDQIKDDDEEEEDEDDDEEEDVENSLDEDYTYGFKDYGDEADS